MDGAKFQPLTPATVVGAPPAEGEGVKVIVTHDGCFHCDDVLAVVLLRHLAEYHSSVIVRTRKQPFIDSAAIVVDVGGVYEPENLRFDHHQKSFTISYSDSFNTTKMSSCGMIWKHFGERILKQLYPSLSSEAVPLVKDRMYKLFFEGIDAKDNGVTICGCGQPEKYSIGTDLTSRVHRCNAPWNKYDGDDYVNSADFARASEIVREEFHDVLRDVVESWLPAREIVARAFIERHTAHPSGRIIVLEVGCPFVEHLYDLEREHGIQAPETSSGKLPESAVLYVVYPNDASGKSWRTRTVGFEKEGFKSRLPLPANYCGKTDLPELSGIPSLRFVHATGFTGATASKEDAVLLAEHGLKTLEAEA